MLSVRLIFVFSLVSVAEFQTKEDVYCFALTKALYSVPTPVTVGFYAPWGHCKNLLLQKIQRECCPGEHKEGKGWERMGITTLSHS